MIVGGALMLGVGIGFVFDKIPAGALIGLGAGLLIEAVLRRIDEAKRTSGSD